MEPVVVEVKSILKQGLSLFGYMMNTVNQLEPGQSLIVKSSFNPRPLVSQMRRRGYRIEQEKIGKMMITTFIPQNLSHDQNRSHSGNLSRYEIRVDGPEVLLDNRGLVPPEPMQRTLATLEEVPLNSVVVIHNDRIPVFLLEYLDDHGFPYETMAQDDDSAIVRILKVH
ncbi:DUF2249 domain-containing protein [Sulfobacillus thermosulfidooxidans]|uniref:DUF2249 domain-containing protein n=1 Tax=Sulfobacillus thermosulfidooxidans TaxID=28034 RepID=UPI0009EC33A3|nr:DUF2249 domain-containing protein [Sulfobacillus thermosulfidooxidans]